MGKPVETAGSQFGGFLALSVQPDVSEAGGTAYFPQDFTPLCRDIETSQISFSEHCKSCPFYVHL